MALPDRLSIRMSLALATVFAVAVVLMLYPSISAHFVINTERVDRIPDMKQTDKRFGFPEHGKDFCAPVVVADSFVYLSNNGFGNIFGHVPIDSSTPPLEAVQNLAELMHTRTGQGTTTEDFLQGVKQYVEHCTPYKIKSLEYEGWNRHPAEFDFALQGSGRAVQDSGHAQSDNEPPKGDLVSSKGHPMPDLEWIKSGVKDNNSCWINIGWYQEDAQAKELKRISGHWVVLIGYGMEIDGVANPNTLIVRDPDPVLSAQPRKIFITLKPMTEGTLTGPHEGLPRSAAGYYRAISIGDGVDTSRKRIGIIDGAILLKL